MGRRVSFRNAAGAGGKWQSRARRRKLCPVRRGAEGGRKETCGVMLAKGAGEATDEIEMVAIRPESESKVWQVTGR